MRWRGKINRLGIGKPGFILALRVCVCVCAQTLQLCLFATLWTVAHQAPKIMGFSRLEYWSGLPCPPAGPLPDPGIEPASPVASCIAGRIFTAEPPGKPRPCLAP